MPDSPLARRRRSTRPVVYRRYVFLPALLVPATGQRMQELDSGGFTRFAVELVCYDLRTRRNHSITREIAKETEPVQEAIDRYIVRQYRPGMKRSGESIRALVRKATEDAMQGGGAESQGAPLVKEKRLVYFPPLLGEAIETRWQELGFGSVSEYVTSLTRYDLLIGGPHKYFHGDDCSPEMLAALDRETLEMFHANAKPQTMADRIMEEEVGRPISQDEADALLRIAAKELRKRAIAGWETRFGK